MMRLLTLAIFLALTMSSCGTIERDQYGRPVCPFGFCAR